jgi:hypothetical protein
LLNQLHLLPQYLNLEL